jgi:protein JBTS26
MAEPSNINILEEYTNDPRTIDKLMDGFYNTCDDMHVWLAPYTKNNQIFIELPKHTTISMIRIWNYNKNRIHSYRGAKDIKI